MIHLIRGDWDTHNDRGTYWDGGGVDALGSLDTRETYDPSKATCIHCLEKASTYGDACFKRMAYLMRSSM